MRTSLLLLPVPMLLGGFLLACGGSDQQFVDPGDTLPGDETSDGASETLPGDGGGETAPPDGGEDGTPPTDGGSDGATDSTPPPTDSTPPPVDAPSDAILPDGGILCTEPGAKVYNGHCYFRLEPTRSWTNQQAACAATPGKTHLVVITTDGEQAFVSSNYGGFTDKWIGLARKPTDPSAKASFKWVTGETSTFDFWNVGEPNGSGACARMIATGGVGGGHWADRSCDQLQQAICERE